MEEILLLSGNDIPFFPAQLLIHQPKIKEIAYIGEEHFFVACQILDFSKESLSEEEQEQLVDVSDFEILMSMLLDEQMTARRLSLMLLFQLLFPSYNVEIMAEGIQCQKKDNEDIISMIDKENFEEFREIIRHMFDLLDKGDHEYKPKNEAAKKIADKLKKGRERRAKLQQKEVGKFSVFSRYVSVLAVGLPMSFSSLMEYTVYQLFDSFKRFQLKDAFNLSVKAKIAGATDVNLESWMEDIHNKKD